MKIIRVGLDVPVSTLFDYRCDSVRHEDVGSRVLVPFGKKTVVGIIVEIAAVSALPHDRLKTALRILCDVPPLSAADLRLLQFASNYYHHPLGATIMNALPARLRRATAAQRAAPACYVLTAAGSAATPDMLPARATVKRRLLALFKQQRALDPVSIKALAATAPAALKQLLALG